MLKLIWRLIGWFIFRLMIGTGKIEGISVVIGGRRLIAAPLLLGFFEKHGEAFKTMNPVNPISAENVHLTLEIALASLRRNHPLLSRKWLVQNLDAKSVGLILQGAMAGFENTGENASQIDFGQIVCWLALDNGWTLDYVRQNLVIKDLFLIAKFKKNQPSVALSAYRISLMLGFEPEEQIPEEEKRKKFMASAQASGLSGHL